MKFAKPRIVAKKMQLFEGSRVLLARGYSSLVSPQKQASGDVFALSRAAHNIFLQFPTNVN